MSSDRGGDGGPDAWIGRVVEGRYRVHDWVGAGGMGTVYRVEHIQMGKIAAMKVLHRDLARHPGAIARFRQEVQAVSRLDHPNIVQTFDCGRFEGQLFLIMEYLRGEDLSTIVWREGPLPPPRALTLAVQICGALEEAHERGVVHCDLKPENVVCCCHHGLEQAKVLDFGLARLNQLANPREPGAASELIGGTPSYMSPEQVLLEQVDPRTDLYSLGATLYRLLTGHAPFEASSSGAILRGQLLGDPVPPSVRVPALQLPTFLDRIILRAMARRPEERYPSATAMRDELEAALHRLDGTTPFSPASRPRSLPADSAPAASATGALTALERDDFAVFERRLRRRRRLGMLLPAPLVLLIPALVVWGGPRLLQPGRPNDPPAVGGLLGRGRVVSGHIGRPGPDGRPGYQSVRMRRSSGRRPVAAAITWELEPNDRPAEGTAIFRLRTIHGHLLSPDDQDWYRVRVPPGRRLEGQVEVLDDTDLVLLIGGQQRRIDRRPAGEREVFSAVAPSDGLLLIGVAARSVLPPPILAPAGAPHAHPYTVKLRLLGPH